MPEWLKATLAVLVFVGLAWSAVRLLRVAQEGDPTRRGRDSDDWTGPHEDPGPGGP